MNAHRWMLVATCFCIELSFFAPSRAEDAPRFNQDIRPILSDKCFACHGPDPSHRQADLRLDLRESATADQDGVIAIVPGSVDQGELVARIDSDDESVVMPPPEHGKPLTEEERALLKRWIAAGAPYEEHWSFAPLVRPATPQTEDDDWTRTPVDAFVLRKLQAAGVGHSPTADPRVLIRRLSFDLTGLPPSPEWVEAYEQNPTAEAYDQIVERLLTSPHYGERMAMYWLDLVRYADTLGYHGDQDRSVSPYRDYVIQAFNQNKPFDQFTREQLAGDLLPEADLAQRVASTYNRLNRASGEGGGQPKEYLAKYAADRVRTTGAVWLGATFGCAECHDHKFDPFTTKDFYSFAAFFADIKEQGIVGGANHIEQLPVPTPRQQAELDRLAKELAQAEATFAASPPELDQAFAAWVEQLRQQEKRWLTLRPIEAQSEGGATLTVKEDASVLASGANPDKDVYMLTAEAPVDKIAALRLELLPDDSLPAKGPGRASNGNLVIHRVEAALNDRAVDWQAAKATHSQTDHAAEHIVNGKKNGWAILPQVGQVVQLLLVAKPETEREPSAAATDASQGAAAPVGESDEGRPARLSVRIHQNHGAGHNVGRFRLHVATSLTAPEAESLDALESLELAALARTPDAQRSEQQTRQLREAFRKATPLLASLRQQIAALKQQRTRIEKTVVTTLATKAAPEPRLMRVLPRGNWMDDSGPVVSPAVPAFLPQPKQSEARLNRLDLANWLTSRENPLVARTFVNRIWMLYFGHGLSRSVDDLGSQGDWPTHPELLDWLATEFIDSGWDVKHIVELMVRSNTYRQTSRSTPELRKLDPFNKLFARQSRWRLDAEAIRDNALKVSGLLVDDVGGTSVKPYQPAGYWGQLNFPKREYQHDSGAAQYRRGLYTHWQRTFLHPSLLAFDAPAREECTARRERSNTPLQSLVLLNDPSYVEAARMLAARIITESTGDFSTRLQWAYREVLSRQPTDAERDLLESLWIENQETYADDLDAARRILQTGLTKPPEEVAVEELASWTAVARALLNLHETITRY